MHADEKAVPTVPLRGRRGGHIIDVTYLPPSNARQALASPTSIEDIMVPCTARRLFASTLLGGLLFIGLESHAASPVVPGFERFGRSGSAPAPAGELLLTELNCVLCHAPAKTNPKDAAKKGPVLDDVGLRVRTGYLKKFLRDPHQTKPGTPMPDLFEGDPERDAKVEALVHFLATTGTPKQERPDAKAAKAGRDLYHRVGCVACHGTRDAKGNAEKTTPANVPLVGLSSKYTITSLAAFLENPHQARPSGRMPLLLIDGKDRPKEARELANYLLTGVKVNLPAGKGTTKFAYYEGGWDRLPDFTKLKPNETGVAAAFDLVAARRHNDYALVFDGVFKIEKEGQYKFWLSSDDGSKLYIDDKLVVDNDGVHPPKTVTNSTRLSVGLHRVRVAFFQAGGGDELSVEISGSGLAQQNLGGICAVDEKGLEKVIPVVAKDDGDYVDVQPKLVERGKALFASAGCANCHSIKGFKSDVKAPALANLDVSKGCLATTPRVGLPHYGLDEAQRKALTDAVRTPAAAPTPSQAIARTLLTFNCYACHVRDKIGGPEDDLNKFFQTSQPEMGDEARVPPPIDNVGGKLRPNYLATILDKGAHDRPYMLTRMPAFGATNVGHLQAAFAEADKDKFAHAPEVAFKETLGKMKSLGRHMAGGQAFGCVKCHTFAGNKAEGVQGIDMTVMTARLQRDWFFAYLADPQKIRQGTRMPSIFDKGKSMLPDVLGGSPAQQSEAFWLYLSDGKKAQLPIGVAGKKSIPLVPEKSAIVYRNFIEGAGSRAIGVGYPEHVNLAFDANDIRLAMIWHGAFMDAGRHWNGRGEGYEPPLGDNVLNLPKGPAFAILAKPGDDWPTAPAKSLGIHFSGYRLSADDRPTFLYAIGGVKVEDFAAPLVKGKDATLRRTIELTEGQGGAGLYYRAAIGNKIESGGNDVYVIDGAVRMTVQGSGTPLVRQLNGRKELLVPVVFTNGKARIVQEYAW
jgi:cytochrome c553